MALLLASCATNGPATSNAQSIADVVQTKPVVVDTACKWVNPIYISKADLLSEGTAKQILALNRTYVARCGEPKKP